MGLSFWHILIVFLVVLLFFGVGRIQEVLAELGKGVKAFKEGMGEGSPAPARPAKKPVAQPVAKKVAARPAAKGRPAPKKAAPAKARAAAKKR